MATLNLQNEAPGVFVREFDQSVVTPLLGPTTTYLVGFAPQGPTDEPTYITNLSEFEVVFGRPTTAAERYAYDSAKQLLTTSNGRLLFTRMPYGSGCGVGFADVYSALVYPVIGLSATEKDVCDYYTALTPAQINEQFPWLSDQVTYNQTLGSVNIDCVLNPIEDTLQNFVVHNYPFPCNGVLESFTFVVDADTDVEHFTVYSLSADGNGNYSILEQVTISGDEGVFNSDGRTKTVSFDSVEGLTAVAGGIFATSTPLSSYNTFSYYNVDGNGKSTVLGELTAIEPDFLDGTSPSALSIGTNTGIDYLVSVDFVPNDECARLSCETVTALGLTIPEAERYTLQPVFGECEMNDANFYAFMKPKHVTLNETEYELFKNGQFSWKCACFGNAEPMLDLANNDVRAGLIIINEIKAAQLDDYSGYYVTVNDNYNVNAATDFDAVKGVSGKKYDGCYGVMGDWEQLEDTKLNFNVHAPYNGVSGSLSEIIESNIAVDFGKDQYKDSLIVSMFKLRPAVDTDVSKLDSILVEKFIASLNSDRKVEDADGGPARSMYLETVVNDSSNYMSVYVNPYISENNCWTDSSGNPIKTVRMFGERTSYISDEICAGGFTDDFADAFAGRTCEDILKYSDQLYSIGSYSTNCVDKARNRCISKDIGNLPCKLERALTMADNPLVFDYDITLDSGLSTIWATRQAIATDPCQISTDICYHYDDSVYIDTNSLSPFDGGSISSPIQDGWESIYNIFNNFAQFTRKANGGVGHLHVQDPLRQIFVNGKDFKVVNRQKKVNIDPNTGQPTERFSTFSRNIWTYLRNLYQSVNSSYVASYANWVKDYDQNSDKTVWLPISGRIAAMYNRIDSDSYPWYSPFGTNRGVLPNILDLAINANNKEQGLIYRLGLNPVVLFPEGYVVWGNKTMLKKNSALSKVNVRRGLIFMEKLTQIALREFIGEPNTIVTRTRVVNKLTPIFEEAKNNQGLYDYRIVVTASPTDIDNGCLKVSIYVSPVKGIEYILADFFITRTGVSMGEMD